MNQIQVTCDKECIYRNDGFCECDQHLLDIAEEFLRLKRGEEVEHLRKEESYWCQQVWKIVLNMNGIFFMSLFGSIRGKCFLKKNVIQNLEENYKTVP